MLAADVQHPAAGDQHGHERGAGHQVDDHGGGVDHVLEVVEHEEDLPGPEPPGHHLAARLLRRLRQSEGVGDGREHHGGIAHGGELDHHDAVGERVAGVAGDLERQPGLPAPAGAGHRHQASGVAEEQGPQLVDLAVPAHQLARRAGNGELPRRRGGRRQVEGRVLHEDGVLEVLQAAPGFEAELVAQGRPGGGEGGERFGLAAAAVQGEGEALVQALPQRVFAAQLGELGDGPLVAAGGELGVEAVLDALVAQLLEAGRLSLGERLVGDVGERRAPPQRQGSGRQGGRQLGVAWRRGRRRRRRAAPRSGRRRRRRARRPAGSPAPPSRWRRRRAPPAAGRRRSAAAWRPTPAGLPTVRR